MDKKKALITGITGQDGSYLAEYLVEQGYEVFGLLRRTSLDPLLRIHKLADDRTVKLMYGNLRDNESLVRVLNEVAPHEVYNLAALSDVGISFKCPEETYDINYLGVGRLIDASLTARPDVRIYQASTSEMFGKTESPQNENSAFLPVSPYAEAKLKAFEEYVKGNRAKGHFVASGILFNHESPRRGQHFVTRKITISLANIKLGLQSKLSLGNLEAKRDWGYAGDYVKAMHLMLQQETPDDFVISTGEAHSVREFVEAACRELDISLTWSGRGVEEVGTDQYGNVIVDINKEFYRPAEVPDLKGDSTKAQTVLGWKPEVTFKELVSMMVSSDLESIRKSL